MPARCGWAARRCVPGAPQTRAGAGIARTFQTPRIVGEASVLANVMIGGTVRGRCQLHRGDAEPARGTGATSGSCANGPCWRLQAVGLERLADVRADRLQHSELRFLEIARALMPDPAFLLLDEPAAGSGGR